MNPLCRCLLSSDKDSLDFDGSVAEFLLQPLDRESTSKIFMKSIASHHGHGQIEYDMDKLMQHDGLHDMLRGSARITQRVAECVNVEAMHNGGQLSIDEIVAMYPRFGLAQKPQGDGSIRGSSHNTVSVSNA